MVSHDSSVHDIQHWWNKALLLARSDELGHHLMRTFELMQSVVDNGLKEKILPLKAEALRMDCDIALAEDPNRNDSSALHYGITDSICIMLIRLAEAEGNRLLLHDDQRDEIELWRTRALIFARSDFIGHLLISAIEFIQSVCYNGLQSRSMSLKIMALSMECAVCMADDPNRENLSRSLHYGIMVTLCTMLKSLARQPLENAAMMPREHLGASLTVKDFEDMSIEEFRAHFHRLLRICANYRKVIERRNLLILLFAYHRIERGEPLLNLECMTADEQMNIYEFHTRVLDALFDEEAMVGSEDIRSVVAGYTLFRTEVHSVAQRILALGSSNVFYLGRYLLSEIRLRYWAFGPEFDKRLSTLASDAVDLNGWWCGNRALTPTDRNESTPYVKKAKDRIHYEYKLAD